MNQSEQSNLASSIGKFLALASASGGLSLCVLESESLPPAVLAKMARQVRYLYVTGFYPAAFDGRRHQVEVVLSSKDLSRIERGERTIRH